MVSFFKSKPITSIAKTLSLISKNYKQFTYSCLADLGFFIILGILGGFVLDQLNSKAIQYTLDLAGGTASTGGILLWGVISAITIFLIYLFIQGTSWWAIENISQKISWKKYIKTFTTITIPLFIAFLMLRIADYAISIKSLADKIIYSAQYPLINAIPYLYLALIFAGLLMYAQQTRKPSFKKWKIILSILLITIVFWLAADFIVAQLYNITALQTIIISSIGLRLSDAIGLIISLPALSLIKLYWTVSLRK